MPTVFFIGATGSIGGTVLEAIVKAYPSFTYKALVRNESALAAYNDALGPTAPKIESVKGTYDDVDLIAQVTSESDYVVNTADCDNVGLKDALLKGLRKHFDEGKGLGGLVQISGCAIYLDGPKDGKHDPRAKVWTDEEEDVHALKETQLHGQVIVPILKAQEEGYFNAFIISPPGVHGVGGPLKRPSLFYKYLISDPLATRRFVHIGEGTNLVGFVNVNDLARLFAMLFQQFVEANGKKLVSSPYERYFLPHSEFMEMKTLFALMAAELYKHGKLDSPEVSSVTYEEANPVLAFMSAQNCLYRPVRTQTLGWNPTHPVLKETVAEDIALTLKMLS